MGELEAIVGSDQLCLPNYEKRNLVRQLLVAQKRGRVRGHCRFRPVVLAQKHTQAQPTFEKYIANLDKNAKTELDTPENASLGEVRKEHGFH